MSKYGFEIESKEEILGQKIQRTFHASVSNEHKEMLGEEQWVTIFAFKINFYTIFLTSQFYKSPARPWTTIRDYEYSLIQS